MARNSRPLRVRDMRIYSVCDGASGILICLMVVFSPWAFGTTQPWAIWTMNIAGYWLGFLLAIKLAIRHFKEYRPPRWGEAPQKPSGVAGWFTAPNLTSALAALTVAVLGFCLISALNARSTYHEEALSFDYHNYTKWLPHSLDGHRTWLAFWNNLALACSFWAVR